MRTLGDYFGCALSKAFLPAFRLAHRCGNPVCPLVTLPIAAHFEGFHIEFTGQFIFALSWLVLVLSLGAISLLNYLIRHGSAVNVASLFYLTPPVTALIAWVFI